MRSDNRRRRLVSANGWWCAIVCSAAILAVTVLARPASADCPCGKTYPHLICRDHGHVPSQATAPGDMIMNVELGAEPFRVESPEQEHKSAMNHFNKFCIRCHGVDGRGVWDISDIPDFTNHVWQATRPEDYRSRVILEGRGAIMPSFRGQITLQEAWALARYLRTLEPGYKASRPSLGPAPAPPAAPAPAAPPPASPIKPASTPELRERVNRLSTAIQNGPGGPKPGKQIFDQRCIRCHTLFGHGGRVGPDLTTFRRDDLEKLLLHIVDPNAGIREGFVALVVATTDGRIMTGILVKEDKNTLVLRGDDGAETTIERSIIEESRPSPKSIMPEGLLDDLNDQQTRDFFSYLRGLEPILD